MKVLILTDEPFPNGMASTKRLTCVAKALISAGTDVKVIVFKRTEIFGFQPRNISGEGEYEGIRFEYVSGTPLRAGNKFRRFLDDFCDRRRTIAFLESTLSPRDVVIGFAVNNIFFINRIISTVHNAGARYVADVCELPFATVGANGMAHFKRFLIQRIQFPKYDGIMAISDPLVEYSRKYAGNRCSIIKIPILVDFEKYNIPDTSSGDDIYIFHSGTLSAQKDGFPGMVEAFGRAVANGGGNMRFITTGKVGCSPDAEEIENIILKYGLKDRFEECGYVCDEKLQSLLGSASIVIINKFHNEQNKYCFSTKLGEYMAAGKAVITTRVGEAVNWLKNGYDSIIVNPGNSNELAEAILSLTDSEKRRMLGENARKSCRKNFSCLAWGKVLDDFCKKI